MGLQQQKLGISLWVLLHMIQFCTLKTLCFCSRLKLREDHFFGVLSQPSLSSGQSTMASEKGEECVDGHVNNGMWATT